MVEVGSIDPKLTPDLLDACLLMRGVAKQCLEQELLLRQ